MNNMKKIAVLAMTAALLTSATAFAKNGTELIDASYSNIKIFVDDTKVVTVDVNGDSVEPFIYNGTTYLPVRAVGEAVGMEVSWDGETRSVYLATKADAEETAEETDVIENPVTETEVATVENVVKTIEAAYSDIKIYVDNVQVETKDVNGNSVEPFIYNGTTYLPVRAVGEAVGKEVSWDGETRSVYLDSKAEAETPVEGETENTENTETEEPEVAPAEPVDLMTAGTVSDQNGYKTYFADEYTYATVNGKDYTSCFSLEMTGMGWVREIPGYVVFDLDKEYDEFAFSIGAIDSTGMFMGTLKVYADGTLVETFELTTDDLSIKNESVKLNKAKQLKIEFEGLCEGQKTPQYAFITATVK